MSPDDPHRVGVDILIGGYQYEAILDSLGDEEAVKRIIMEKR